MAFFQVNFFSEILCFHTDVNVFIPTPDSAETVSEETCAWFQRGSRFPVMYLLHGTYGDYTDWLRLTGVERYAKQHRMALVMPSASNSFYHDMKAGANYLSYLTRELPAFIIKYFPISGKREDTFIAGLSMGGYGAMKAALEYPEKYAACASLSGILDVQEFREHIYKYLPENPYFWDCIFEDPARINGENLNLISLLEKQRMKNRPLPRIYQSVGTEDTTAYEVNQAARRRLEVLDIDYTYRESEGIHDWEFWDKEIKNVLSWIKTAGHCVKG